MQKLKLGFGTKIQSPMIANILIPEFLGYYREEGLTLEFLPLGPNSVVMEQIASRRIDFATAVPAVQLPVPGREGVPAGQALQRGAIDALFDYDTQFGQIEAVGIKLRYVKLPDNVPHVGGLYITARPEMLREHRNWSVGVGRAVAKAQVFIRENPRAAAYVFLQMFPAAAPKASTLDQQLHAIMIPIVKRQEFFSSYDKSVTKWGQLSAAELKKQA